MLCLLIHACAGQAAILTVGADAACDFGRPERALAAAMHGDEIRLVQSFAAVAAVIADVDVTIRGGFASCTAPLPTGISILDGAGEPQRSILTVRGHATVRIEDVDFVNGDEGDDTDDAGSDDGAGGCIDFGATGSLSLLRSRVRQCHAAAGGGLWFEARGGSAVLDLRDVEISGNAARVAGGGLAIVGAADASISGNGALSDNEVVDGDGGGLYAGGAARVEIAATRPAATADAYLARNRAAASGAAIAVAPGARVRIYSSDPQRSLGIDFNASGESVLRVDSTASDRAAICLWNVDVTQNEGGSIGVARGPQAGIHFNPDTAAGELACGPRPSPARECASSIRCNRIADNDTATPSGGLFVAELGASLSLNRLTVAGNHAIAPMVLVTSTSPAPIALHSTAIWRNGFEGGLLRANGSADLSLRQLTVADNGIKGTCMLCIDDVPGAAVTRLLLAGAIIDQPQRLTIEDRRPDGQTQAVVRYSALSDTSTAPVASEGVVRLSSPGDPPPLTVPGFADRAQANYELAADSLLVDFSPVEDTITLDALGRPRTRDLPLAADRFGPRDLGAYETPRDIGDIFEDGFE